MRQRKLLFGIIGLAALAIGCGGKAAPATSSGSSGSASSGNVCGDNACGASQETGEASRASGDAAADISGWSEWTKINDAPFKSGDHGGALVDVYVKPEYADQYRALQGPMPAGMAVVKVQHKDEGGTPGNVMAITAMVKMAAGYDADNGDWYYGVYDATGATAKMHGKLGKCIGCHNQYEDQDYVGGVPK